jgi:hypothetical protein
MDIVARARELAHRAHAGQVDKAGRPYIEHVARVAAACAGNPLAEAVAWLHDVMEDHPELEGLVANFPFNVFWPCTLLDRSTAKNGKYYERVRWNPVALRVKLADIADNADEARLALLDPETAERLRRKYAKARAALGVA